MEAIVKVDAYDYSIYGDRYHRVTLTYLTESAEASLVIECDKKWIHALLQGSVPEPRCRFSKQSRRQTRDCSGNGGRLKRSEKSTVFNYLAKPLTKTVSFWSDR